jgi:hypothetical protein
VRPVGFTTTVSVVAFPPSTKPGIGLLDLDQKRLQTASPASGTLFDVTDFVGSPIELVVTPDGAHIYLAQSPLGSLVPVSLDPFDTSANRFTGSSLYEFKQGDLASVPMIIHSHLRS